MASGTASEFSRGVGDGAPGAMRTRVRAILFSLPQNGGAHGDRAEQPEPNVRHDADSA